jgi:SCF-associated factor 1
MIIPYLNAKDLLSFCASTRQLQYNPEIRESASYWSHLTRSTFRVPNHPVVEHDGRRWMRLYRRMRTQTKVYGWGNNDRGCFGSLEPLSRARIGRHGHPQAYRWVNPGLSWPKELDMGVAGGHIADLQCGGWSTVVLSTKGVLSMMGKVLYEAELR